MPSEIRGIRSRPITQSEQTGTMDRYGVDVITHVEEIPDAKFPQLMRHHGSVHPRFSTMAVSKISWQRGKNGFYRVTYTYEGFLVSLPEPSYTLSISLAEEPIELHPKFAEIAGTPKNPKNGAIFVDPDTGKITKDNTRGVFREFSATIGGKENLKAGVEAYLLPGSTWTEVSYATKRPGDLGSLGEIDSPSGSPPSFGSGRNWLYSGAEYTKRGHIYEVRKTWLLSGRRGWDVDIYGS